jgi:uncharacterized protein YajQ (UPF0234 family)
MPSFDIVSEIDKTDIRHAQENASRELETRFDFRGVEASFEWVNGGVKMTTESEFQLTQMADILRKSLIKRNVDSASMKFAKVDRRGKLHIQQVDFTDGIDAEMAKKLTKAIKDSKIKVQTAIQGEQLRVTGKKRDDLQAVMALIRGGDFGQPFQFNNFRD